MKRRKQKKDFSISLTGKHVFGAYFNMARTNFVKTINYILPIAGVRGNYSESQINKMLNALFLIQSGRKSELTDEQKRWERKLILNPEQQTRLQRLLFKHFPVLRPMMADVANHRAYNKKKSTVKTENEMFEELRGISVANCMEVIALMGETLTECRNFYTHKEPYNTPEQLKAYCEHESKIAKKLDKVIQASRRVLKQRKGLTVNEVEFLTGIDRLEKVVIKDETKKSGKPSFSFKEYKDFYFSIHGKKTIKNFTEPCLSDFGLLYFCVLFLSKSYANRLMEEARLFEFSPFDDKENLIMQEMLSIYRIRVPQLHRIDSRDSKATLAMDILAELRRCPIELYDLLDKQKGQPFFHDEVKDSDTKEVSKRLRYSDRFPYLALRYIDENELFKRIRFQLQLGSFRYKFYEKECVDGRKRVRSIQKEINGYGRLQEVCDKRMEKWGKLIQKREERPVKLENEEIYLDLDQFIQDKPESEPYVTDRRPAYNIHANRVGLFWENSQNPKDYKYFDKDNMYIPTLSVNEDGKAPIVMPEPRCSLSVYDLIGMLFYEFLRSKNKSDDPSAEQIIIDVEKEYHSFFKAVADGELKPFENVKRLTEYLREKYPKISISSIPQKIKQYLSSTKPTYKGQRDTPRRRLIRQTIENLKEREECVQRRLKHYKDDRNKIGEEDNSYGKKTFAEVRHGDIARYIAESLIEWQPSNDKHGGDKVTGMNYNVLTAYLATFGTSQPEDYEPRSLRQVLKEVGLIDSGNSHPFIERVLCLGNNNIEQLYLNYLTEEHSYIRSCRQSLDKNSSEVEINKLLPFVHFNRNRYKERTEETIRELSKQYTTIQLPDGIFTKYILKHLKEHYGKNTKLQEQLNIECKAHLDPTRNASYLISLFYKNVLKDEAQPFYNSNQAYTHEEKRFTFKRCYELFSVLENKDEKNSPHELKPLFLTCEEIQTRLSEKSVDDSGKPKPKLGKKGKDKKDSQGNIVWERKINKSIESYIGSLTDKELKISSKSENDKQKEREEKLEAKRKRLIHQVSDIKNNERALRRYKTQDMVLFLLAREMFVKILSDEDRKVDTSNMLLSNVCNDNFLRQTITFDFPVSVADKTIYVRQEMMSLKNYGKFYRFLNDDRLMTLLENIVDRITPDGEGKLVIQYTDLMSEFANYDQKRSAVFELIQQIESYIIKEHPELLDPNQDGFWVREGLARRNSFSSLLELVEKLYDTELSPDEKSIIVAIRNAFSHNSYRIDFSLIEEIENLPEIAKSIMAHLEKLCKTKSGKE